MSAEAVGRIKLASPAGSAVIKGLDGQLRVPDGGEAAIRIQADAAEVPR